MALPPRPADEPHDLGFGTALARESRQRLLNRDGSFNVVRRGLAPVHSLNPYHALLAASGPRFLALVASGYLAVNLLFALLYLAAGPGALRGSAGADAGSRFATAFFFSVHTLATIGYGTISPQGLPANLLVTVEALVGLLGFAVATGVVFARFSRPVARIRFSDRAVIAPYHGMSAWEFRIVNPSSNDLVEVTARVSLSMRRAGGDGRREFFELALERTRVLLFPLAWTVVHPIDAESPLWGMSETDLRAADAEFLVLIGAFDETFSQAVHARSSYTGDEILWDARFAPMLHQHGDGRFGIDVHRLHDVEPAELPERVLGGAA